MQIALVNLKGGTGKTTSAVMLAAALAAKSDSVLLVDADPQGSAMSWAASAELPFAVVALATKTLHKEIEKYHASRYDHIVIDTAPGHLAIARSALMTADEVIIPMQPSTADVDQLQETLATIDAVQDIRGTSALSFHVLLTKVRKMTKSQRQVRDFLEGEGIPVLPTETYLSERFMVAHGEPISDRADYDDVLLDIEDSRATRGLKT